MSRRYAQDTTVPVERSQAEIAKLLADHGADARAVGVNDVSATAVIMFALGGRRVRVEVPVPTAEALAAEGPPRGSRCWTAAQHKAWTTATLTRRERAMWRGLLLLLRAKLEAIEGGYSTVEREFLADVVLPGGATVGQLVERGVEAAYTTGQVPPLLPGLSGPGGEAGLAPIGPPALPGPRLVTGGAR